MATGSLMALAAFAYLLPGAALNDGLARTPPMGWRSWNAFHGNINQQTIQRQVDALASKKRGKSLLELGYLSIGLDDAWQACGTGINGSFHDETGTPLVDLKKFPNMSDMIDYAHAKNVRMGWYLNNCDCSETGRLMPDWPAQMHGDVKALRSMGWDGVKLDSCGPSHQLTEWSDLIAATGKPLVIENCHNNVSFPSRSASGELQCPSHFFRVSSDINPAWSTITRNLQCQIKFNQIKDPLSQPGCWGYPDMLEVGVGQISFAQSRSHFGSWLIVSSPLILGMNMSDDAIMDRVWPIISNEEAINISKRFWLHPGFLVADRANRSSSMHVAAAPSAFIWAVAPNATDSTQAGWSISAGAVSVDGTCLTFRQGVEPADQQFVFEPCDRSNKEQAFTLAPNGNLYPTPKQPKAQPSKCVTAAAWVGPLVMAFRCSLGTNEEWVLDTKNGTLCTRIPSTTPGNHPRRCLAKRPTAAPDPRPKPPSAPPATWQVYAKPQPDNKFAVLLFNLDNFTQDVSIEFEALGYDGPVRLRSVWNATDSRTPVSVKYTATLQPFDSELLMVSPAAAGNGTAGPHPFTKIPAAWLEKMAATQQAAFARAGRCSYHW